MLYAFLLLQTADLLTTWIGMTYYGAHEVNAGVAWMMARYGILPGLLLVKIAAVVFMLAIVRARPRALPKANLVFAAVLVWNLCQLARVF